MYGSARAATCFWRGRAPCARRSRRAPPRRTRAGSSTRMRSPEEARHVVPELDVEGVQAASYNPDDGVVFPWPFVWGYAQAARRLGVEVAPWHEVVGFETSGSRISGVRVRPSGPPGNRQHADDPQAGPGAGVT